MITKETRFDSYLERPVLRRNAILECMGERSMTAREIAYEMGFTDLNAVKPRLTELRDMGIIEAIGKTKDKLTNRSVAVWRKIS